jgi:hypothetical protein
VVENTVQLRKSPQDGGQYEEAKRWKELLGGARRQGVAVIREVRKIYQFSHRAGNFLVLC